MQSRSINVSRHTRAPVAPRFKLFALLLLCFAPIGAGAYAVATGHPYVMPQPEPTFALIGVSEIHEYVIDTGLSADDCRRASFGYDMRFSSLYCEAESNAG